MWHPIAVPDEIDRMLQRYGAATVCDKLTPFITPERLARIDEVLASRLDSVSLVVEDTYDPHNAVAAVRTSEALGVSALHAIEGADHFRLAPGITRGCHRWMDIHRWRTPADCAAALRARGFALYATAPEATHDVETMDVTKPVAVMFGNEHAGLTAAAEQQCDGTVRIPMYGFTESYNLSVSVALVLSRLTARRRALLQAPGDLSPERALYFRARWIALKVRAATEIMERVAAQ